MHNEINLTLTYLYVIGAYLGSLACVYLMQTKGASESGQMDPPWLQRLWRGSLAALALSMLYGANYVANEIAAPWLPNVLLIWTISLTVVCRIISNRIRAPVIHKLFELGLQPRK